MTEIQRYQVLESHPGFELRDYAEHILVTKPTPGSMGSAGSNAFRYLAGYIGGENEQRTQIAMTAPVLQRKSDAGYDVSFVMPHDMTSAPRPLAPGMRIEQIPSVLMAANRFSGAASDSLFERKGRQLVDAVRAAGFEIVGEVQYARYNGPWTPPILRRNEVLVAVARPSSP